MYKITKNNNFILIDLWLKFIRIFVAILLIIIISEFDKEIFFQRYSKSFITASLVSLPFLSGFDAFLSKELKKKFLSIYYILILITLCIYTFLTVFFDLSVLIGINAIIFNYFIVSWKVKLDNKFIFILFIISIMFLVSISTCIYLENPIILLFSIVPSIVYLILFIYNHFHKNDVYYFRKNINVIRKFNFQKLVDQGGTNIANYILVNLVTADIYFIVSNLIKISNISHSIIYTKVRNLLFGSNKINFIYNKTYITIYLLSLNILYLLFMMMIPNSYSFELLIYSLLITLHLILNTKKDILFWPNAYPKFELISNMISLSVFCLISLDLISNNYLLIILVHGVFLVLKNLISYTLVKFKSLS